MNFHQPFFRRESLDARRLAWLGRPTVVSPLSRNIVAAFSIFFVVTAVLFITFGTYTRRVQVSGVLLPTEGVTRLSAPQTGRVQALFVADGAKVKMGDVLYVLGLDSTTSLGDTQAGVSAALQDRNKELEEALTRQIDISKAAKDRLIQQISGVSEEIEQVEAQVVLLDQITGEMKDFTTRQQQLLAKGMSVSTQYEARVQAYNDNRVQLASLLRDRIQLRAKRADLENELSSFDLDASEKAANIRQQVLDVRQQIAQTEAKREVRITAPRDGTITGIFSVVGQTVNAGTPLLTIVPDDQPLIAQLLAPTNAIGFIKDGSDVLLRYAAFPYQKFGQYPGTVNQISRTTLRPEEIAMLNAGGLETSGGQSLYRITVLPKQTYVDAYGRRMPLQAGMQVEAHILAETRPLYQWVLEPIYGLKGSVAEGASAE
jgi:membrane fusion protein